MASPRYVEHGITMAMFIDDLRRLGIPADTIWDIGSRDGQDALRLLQAFPGAAVTAFEAHPEEYARHRGVARWITWVNAAVYSHDGEVEFFPKAINSGIHSIRDRGAEFGTGSMRVACTRVDTYVRDTPASIPDVVKIDVEGCTYEVLCSFGDLLESVRALHIETEEEQYFAGQHLQEEVFALLRGRGFVMVTYSTTPGSNQHDSVWIREPT